MTDFFFPIKLFLFVFFLFEMTEDSRIPEGSYEFILKKSSSGVSTHGTFLLEVPDSVLEAVKKADGEGGGGIGEITSSGPKGDAILRLRNGETYQLKACETSNTLFVSEIPGSSGCSVSVDSFSEIIETSNQSGK